jgi:hypothetical protein
MALTDGYAPLVTALIDMFTVAADAPTLGLAPETQAIVLANAIHEFVKTALVTVPTGVPVSTTGTAAEQTGATTSAGIGGLT